MDMLFLDCICLSFRRY